jgi:FAD:protein FMN transferase
MIAMNKQLCHKEFRAMGTEVAVDIVTGPGENEKKKIEKTLNEIRKIFENNENIFSRFKEESELSKVNAQLGRETKISPKLFEMLTLCLAYYKKTDKYFDPRILTNLEAIGYTQNFADTKWPEINLGEKEAISNSLEEDLILNKEGWSLLIKKKIDTSGIVKGFTVDEAAQFLKSNNFRNFIVDAGGDMYLNGLNERGKAWEIGLEGSNIKLQITDEGVATSGISRKRWRLGEKKFHHLINPKKFEEFKFEIKSVTVISQDTIEADVLAKSLFLMGKEAGLERAKEKKIKALFLDYKSNAYLSEEIKKNIV